MASKGDMDYVTAQVKAAESELEAAKARAEAARMHVQTTQTRGEVFQEQLEAAKAQVAAAQAQAQAANGQREAATVQAEAAIAQVEATREHSEAIKSQIVVAKTQTMTLEEQAETVKSQVSLMRTQTDTLQEQLAVMKRQARGTSWLAVLATIAALSIAALAGLNVYRFVNATSGPVVAATPQGPAASPAASEDGNGPAAGGVAREEVDSRLEPIQAEQNRTKEAMAALSARVGLVASRLVQDETGGTTKRIKVLSPPIESGAKELSWSTPALASWLEKGQQVAGESRNVYDISGTVKRPVKPGQRVTVDLFEGRWWPGGSSIGVATDGRWHGSIQLDPTAPPGRLRVTIWDGDQAASTVYTFGSASGEAASSGESVGADEAPAGGAPRPARAKRPPAAPAAPPPSPADNPPAEPTKAAP